MAWSTVTTEIQNPAGKRSNMTAKPIKYFGSKRQKAALKAKRSKARHSAAKHKARTKPNAAHKARSSHHYSKKKAKNSHRPKPVKRNPGPELVAFVTGNSATKGKHKVAHSKKKKKSSASHRKNAGSGRGKYHFSKRKRSNPAGISLKDMVYGGGGGLVGFFGSAFLAQLAGPSNTGMVGYGLTALAVVGLTILSHMFVKDKAATFGVAIGGVMNLGRRIITDQTPFGAYLTLPQAQGGLGMGDYMVANWGPPTMTDGLNSAMAGQATPAIASSGINMQDMADLGGARSRPC